MIRPADRRLLRELGWRNGDRADVVEFQRGYALGGALVVDGKVGARTRAALNEAVGRGRRGQPTASRHFSFAEFRCSCGGQLRGCAVQRVHRELLLGLEAYRWALARPVTIVSGYRCPERNRQVGGASSSQHLYGAAADVNAELTVSAVVRLRRFAGVGTVRRTGKVRHVDVRHVSGHNSSGGTPDRPTRWHYA